MIVYFFVNDKEKKYFAIELTILVCCTYARSEMYTFALNQRV